MDDLKKMENQQVDLKCQKATKRSRESADNPNQKKQKIETSPLKLEDINDDCLRSIFKYLDMNDLASVAAASDRFVPVASEIFSRHYRNCNMILDLSSIITSNNVDYKEIEKSEAINIFNHFGHSIKHLLILMMGQINIDIEKSLLRNCADSLVSLRLSFCGHHSFEMIENPFERVEELIISKSFLGTKLSQLNVWFPNLISLELFHVKFMKPQSIETNFAQLKSLTIKDTVSAIPQSTIFEMLCLNPQLETLILKHDYDFEFIRSIGEHLSLLVNLELWWSSKGRCQPTGNGPINFENVKKFTLNNASNCMTTCELFGSFVFGKLQELSLKNFNDFDELMAFVLLHENLVKLTLHPKMVFWDDLDYSHLAMITDGLPKMVELEFCADLFTIQEIAHFLHSDGKNLQKVHLLYERLVHRTEFKKAFQDDWNISTFKVNMIGDFENTKYFLRSLERKN